MTFWLKLLEAIGLLIMMYPILCKVQFEALHLVFRKRELWIQIGFSIIVNWIIAPFVMVSLIIHCSW
jgi:ACR3 family arsenite transporter